MPHRMILSVHIPKTGGVSIRNILKEHYGPGFVLFYWEATDAEGNTLPEVPATATCVHGHYPADYLTGRFPAARLMTWVRDPVERVVSSYYFRLRSPDWRHPVCQLLHTKKLSLVEYAALPLVRNEMAHFFGTKRPSDFAFIGLMEEFDVSLAQMAHVFGMSTVKARYDNANPARTTPRYELDADTRLAISRLNELDIALYEDCLEWRAGMQLERLLLKTGSA